MGINKDLNIDPYFENFYDPANPQYKQYNRILFRPARAVQARELTQLQTILQEQIGRFGSNVYQEGTIITGINTNQRNDIFYVKLKDTEDLPDPTIYEPVTNYNDIQGEEVTTEYFLQGQTTGLRANILKADNGFQTRDPDLKTFYINYLNTVQNDQNEDVKEFDAGEVLEIQDVNGEILNYAVVAEVDNHAGRSFGISVDEGIIYQKGHFIFAEPQLIILEKYADTPRDVSVGFNVNENIVTSNQDSTLLDNAQGYNNDNAPGADRLQLQPVLAAYENGSTPDDFFSLIRFERGEAISIRNVTEFNSIATAMARRTYEESGDYVVSGMKLTLDKDADGTYAVVSPGKAYVKGYEVSLAGKKYINLESASSTDTLTRNQQGTGADYGQYFEFTWAPPSAGDATIMPELLMDGTRYTMYDVGDVPIGRCSIRAITAGAGATGVTQGRIYVYAIEKFAGKEASEVFKIGSIAQPNSAVTVTSSLLEVSRGAMIFPTGARTMRSISNLQFVQRTRESISSTTGSFVIEAGTNTQPLPTNIFVVNSVNELCIPSSVVASTGTNGTNYTVTLTDLGSGDITSNSFVYYDRLISEVSPDSLQAVDVYVYSNYTGGKANLGIPNCVKLLEVIDDGGNGEDITSRFKLVTNAKDGYYDHSYLSLKKGQTLGASTNLRIKFTALRRTSTVGSGYMTINSYAGIDPTLVIKHSTQDGREISPLNSIDFRPYVEPDVEYALGIGAAQTVSSSITRSFPSIGMSISPSSTILSTQESYLSRIDAIVITSNGKFDVVKGTPAENPSKPLLRDVFQLGEVFIPGGNLEITGSDPLRITTKTIRNYTMKDIGKFDRQIKRLTEQVSLNALENSAKDMYIPDATGANRFKNGFFADTFANLQSSDVADPEFSMSIDTGKQVAQPALDTFSIDLKRKVFRNESETIVYSDNVTAFSEMTTLSETGNPVAIIEQPYATSFRNCVSNFHRYSGSPSITPQFSADHDTVRNPDVNLNIDLATPMIDLLETIQEVIPLTSIVPDGEEFHVEALDVAGERRGASRWMMSGVTETWRQNLQELSVGFDTTGSTEPVGDFVTDLTFRPFMKSKEIKILVTGLRPNTRHYFFFDEGTDVNAHVTPGTYIVRYDDTGSEGTVNVNDVYVAAGAAGQETLPGNPVRSDANGVLAAVFVIPEGTFYAGESRLEITDSPDYNSIESAGTSYASVAYRAYNFEVSRTALDVTTRTPDFRVDSEPAGFEDRTEWRTINAQARWLGDPLAQTFFVKTGMADGAKSIFLRDISLFFKRKDATKGITVEIREVQNGYPSPKILPFAKTYLTSSQIKVSDNGTAETLVTFTNPIKLDIEREYAIVLMPDGNSPEYLVWTSKVGETDLSSGAGVPVTQDWGDGVLFTSTNNRAWKSYQDEDIKFRVRRWEFSDQPGYVDLVPNNPEFLSIQDPSGGFKVGEIAYVKKTSGGSYTISGVSADGRSLTINSSTGFSEGDYVILEKNASRKITRIEEKTDDAGITTLVVDSPVPFDTSSTGNITVTFAVAGEVEYFNPSYPDSLHLKGSSARTLFRIIGDGSETIYGETTGAAATVTAVNNIPVSYFQPMIYSYNTMKSHTSLQLMNGTTGVDKSFQSNDNVYLTGEPRYVPSTSNIVDPGQTTTENFIIRVNMTNSGFTATSPLVDDDLSILNCYQYRISDDVDRTGTYVSKVSTLSDRMYAEGLKVYVGAYRPAGTVVDVYARFTLPTDVENTTDWVLLNNLNKHMFSASYNTRDYREFEYELDEEAFDSEFSAFQVKIVMRHMTTQELVDNSMDDINPEINLFAHLSDIRAIAVT